MLMITVGDLSIMRNWWFDWIPENLDGLMLEPVMMLALIVLLIVAIAAFLLDDNGDPENYE